MKNSILMTVFFMAFVLCGCSLETFFCGGAPFVILAALVALGCAIILGHTDRNEPHRERQLPRGPEHKYVHNNYTRKGITKVMV